MNIRLQKIAYAFASLLCIVGLVGYHVAWALPISTFSYDSVSFDAGDEGLTPGGINFNSSGDLMIVMNNGALYRYDLGAAWDVSSAVYATDSLNLADIPSPTSFDFKPDGTKVFVYGRTGSKVGSYTLSTGWDLSSASLDGISVADFTATPFATGMTVKSDGTVMFLLSRANSAVYQYSLSTPWDLSTATYDSVSMDVSGQSGLNQGMDISSDGTQIFIAKANDDKIHEYSLDTAWDLSSTSYVGELDVTTEASFPNGVAIGNSDERIFVSDNGTDFIYQYSADTTDPTVNSLTPANNAVDVAVDANLVIEFDEAVNVETGDIIIYKAAPISVFETIDVTSGQVTGNGTDTIIINPSSDFVGGATYFVNIDATAFDDLAGNSYAGIVSPDKTSWRFTVIETTAPIISSLSPADDSADNVLDPYLTIEFSEPVDVESGNITIYRSADDSVLEVIDVTGPYVTGTGTDTIIIDPNESLLANTSYYIQIDATAFDDLVGNSFPGISDSTTWNIDTGAATFQNAAGGGGIVTSTQPTIETSAPQPDNSNTGNTSGASSGVKDISELIIVNYPDTKTAQALASWIIDSFEENPVFTEIAVNILFNTDVSQQDLQDFVQEYFTPVQYRVETNRLLRVGVRGADVQMLQKALNQGLNLSLDTDGIFGPATKAAVEAFQRANNLLVDGLVGPQTLRYLNQ